MPSVFENTDFAIFAGLMNLCPEFVHVFSGLTNHSGSIQENNVFLECSPYNAHHAHLIHPLGPNMFGGL